MNDQYPDRTAIINALQARGYLASQLVYDPPDTGASGGWHVVYAPMPGRVGSLGSTFGKTAAEVLRTINDLPVLAGRR